MATYILQVAIIFVKKSMQSLLNDRITLSRKRLLNHPLYTSIKTVEHLHTFMQSHVYAVWDFMSLLKALQQELTCTSVPWQPVGDPQLRYLINEIVLAEETDLDIDGHRNSHYEMYLDAMQAAGIETTAIEKIIHSFNSIKSVKSGAASLEPHIAQFLINTFDIIEGGKPHEIAAAFTYGREDLIPDMFTKIIKGLDHQSINMDLSKIKYYFDRHIELDGDEHGPMAHRMVSMLCGDDEEKWDEAIKVSNASLDSRYQLFDGILESLN
ncbi:DUF3050 domain-containing protein [Nonlabens ponticola]|uniref:DUF3050 domain-containing protein n=1 Tax=Nonlabens ponticola TaxID=2496866 RepID=A0A3S9MWC2_9FLAO|nr:DUF3050 domain-containing protein [Nonlabens ponticola]AZQ43413.1 DUF3050 domain-containing protein [Nonlabens ponticola]